MIIHVRLIAGHRRGLVIMYIERKIVSNTKARKDKNGVIGWNAICRFGETRAREEDKGR